MPSRPSYSNLTRAGPSLGHNGSLLRAHGKLDIGRRRRRVMNDVGRDPDIGFPVSRQHRVAAVCVACAAREVAAVYVDLDTAACAKRMMDVAEIDAQRINLARHQRLSPGYRVAIH